jgi:hypothetical protein
MRIKKRAMSFWNALKAYQTVSHATELVYAAELAHTAEVAPALTPALQPQTLERQPYIKNKIVRQLLTNIGTQERAHADVMFTLLQIAIIYESTRKRTYRPTMMHDFHPPTF